MDVRETLRLAAASALALSLAACSGSGSGEDSAGDEIEINPSGGSGAGEAIEAVDPDEAASAAPPSDVERPSEPTPEIEGETYKVRVEAPTEVTPGEQTVAAIHVEPSEEWRMNHDFPMSLEVEAPEGIEVVKDHQEIEDAVHYSDERGEWAVTFTPEVGVDDKVFADFRFAVCTDEICVPQREMLAWDVPVQ